MKNILTLNGTWRASWSSTQGYPTDNRWIEAKVPGDFTTDLSRAGIIPEDIYYRDNLKEAKWIEDVYIWYERKVYIDSEQASTHVELVCDGIDMISEIYVNSVSVARTKNAFLQYRIPISSAIKPGDNNILVCMKPARSHIAAMLKEYPDYWALFTPGRNLVRHAQSQFGWDWAPDALSLGIWNDIFLEFTDGNCIRDLYVETSGTGDCIVRIELNYKQESLKTLPKGVPQTELPIYYPEGTLHVEIWYEDKVLSETERMIDGVNVFCGLHIDEPKLWWPNGMGEQNIYTAKVTLIGTDGTSEDNFSANFAFRTVEIKEPVIETDRVGFGFVVNGEPVYARGANWVPLDCFPGLIEPERYEKVLKKAKEAHINILRIWGGGVYEHRHFYELCDSYGIMVWQDFMNACSEIPDDDQRLLDNLIKEAEYQVKRLRNHPSLAIWCGGNESSSSHMYEPDKPGRRIVHYYYRGIVDALTVNTVYIPGSSHSKSDFGQSHTSGETHWSMWPRTKETLYSTYRERLDSTRTVFNGEISLQGPSPIKSMKRFLAPIDMWPPAEIYDFHAMNHPAMPEVHPRWVTSQINATEQIVGECDSIETFVAKGMMMHAMMVSEELLYYRSMRPNNSGALLWMYNEPWPCMNWALIDYYGNTKAAYWAMKRAFGPIACYVKEKEQGLSLYVMTDRVGSDQIDVKISCIDLPDHIIWEDEFQIEVNDNITYCNVFNINQSISNQVSSLLFCKVKTTDYETTYVYHKHLAKNISWPSPIFTWEIINNRVDEENMHEIRIRIDASSYCRFLYIDSTVSDYAYTASESFFDMLPDTTKIVTLTSKEPIKDFSIKSLIN